MSTVLGGRGPILRIPGTTHQNNTVHYILLCYTAMGWCSHYNEEAIDDPVGHLCGKCITPNIPKTPQSITYK